MKAAVKWQKEYMFRGENGNGIQIVMDGNNEEGLEPMSLLLLSLAGSTGINVINILDKMQVNYEDLSLQIEGERHKEEPGNLKRVTLKYVLKGSEMMSDKFKRAIDLSMRKYCSVLHSLDRSINIRVEYCVINN